MTRPAGTGSRIKIGKRGEEKLTGLPWSASSYPFPDERFAPDERERTMATERLYWCSDGTLAFRAGVEYPIEDRPLLATWDELMAPKPEPKKRARR